MNTAHRLLQRASPGRWPLTRVLTLFRFAAVGLASSAAYAVVMIFAASYVGMEATTSSAIAYLAAMMINFPLQRGFTFRSNGHVKGELLKYLAVHLVNMLISVATVHFVVQILGWPVVISVAAVVIVIPFLQFLALEAWVFSTRRQT